MTTFIGFNTINQFKKFTLTDFDLIQRDLLNAFSIRQGELPGRPGYGTTLYDFLFENQVEQISQQIRAEVQRVAGGDVFQHGRGDGAVSRNFAGVGGAA